MYGQNLDLIITMRCCVCKTWYALRVDRDDIQRHANGLFIQDAFSDRSGMPYLDADLRELFISEVGPCCWSLLCPSDPLAYS